jgi:hypothetical protein
MRHSPFTAGLQRKLLAQPGIGARPTCPACGHQRQPADFTGKSGYCRFCTSELDAVIDQWQRDQSEAVRGAAYGDLGLPPDSIVPPPGEDEA